MIVVAILTFFSVSLAVIFFIRVCSFMSLQYFAEPMHELLTKSPVPTAPTSGTIFWEAFHIHPRRICTYSAAFFLCFRTSVPKFNFRILQISARVQVLTSTHVIFLFI